MGSVHALIIDHQLILGHIIVDRHLLTAYNRQTPDFLRIQPAYVDGGIFPIGKFQVQEIARIFRIPPHLVGDLERRVAQIEARLDESIEARERLERQVAAQAEELRVQRAAIARTQRALRSLNRGQEEQATEPALRDPKA